MGEMREEHQRDGTRGGSSTRGQETGFSNNTTHVQLQYMLATIRAMFSSSMYINAHASFCIGDSGISGNVVLHA